MGRRHRSGTGTATGTGAEAGPGAGPAQVHALYPEPIPDSPESVARVLMSSGPPKKDWRYLKDKDQKGET